VEKRLTGLLRWGVQTHSAVTCGNDLLKAEEMTGAWLVPVQTGWAVGGLPPDLAPDINIVPGKQVQAEIQISSEGWGRERGS
jgi:hypothetical protein